jgi:hypothetical protein
MSTRSWTMRSARAAIIGVPLRTESRYLEMKKTARA